MGFIVFTLLSIIVSGALIPVAIALLCDRHWDFYYRVVAIREGELTVDDITGYLNNNEYMKISKLINEADKPLSEWVPTLNKRRSIRGERYAERFHQLFCNHLKQLNVNFEKAAFFFGEQEAWAIFNSVNGQEVFEWEHKGLYKAEEFES